MLKANSSECNYEHMRGLIALPVCADGLILSNPGAADAAASLLSALVTWSNHIATWCLHTSNLSALMHS